MGEFPHRFTAEDRRKAADTKRERAKSFRQLLAERLEDRANELIDAALIAAAGGDWRATVALIEQAYGRAPASIEFSSDPDRPIQIEHSRRLTLADLISPLGDVKGLEPGARGELPAAGEILAED